MTPRRTTNQGVRSTSVKRECTVGCGSKSWRHLHRHGPRMVETRLVLGEEGAETSRAGGARTGPGHIGSFPLGLVAGPGDTLPSGTHTGAGSAGGGSQGLVEEPAEPSGTHAGADSAGAGSQELVDGPTTPNVTCAGEGTVAAGSQELVAGTASLSNPNSPNAVAVGAGPAAASP